MSITNNFLIMIPIVSFLAALRLMTDAQSCNNGLGRLVYEKVSDYKLTGSFGKQHIEAVSREGLPIKVLEDCMRRCQEDKLSAIENCHSFDFFPGQRRSSPFHKQANNAYSAPSNSYSAPSIIAEYDESKCLLFDERGSPDGDDAFVRSDNSWHFNEVCLNSPKIVTDCSNRLYVFERIPGYRLDGASDKELDNVSNRTECEDHCLNSQEFICRSLSYDRVNKKCHLSKETRYMNVKGFKMDSNCDYLENMCLKKLQLCPSAAFVREINKELDGSYERELISAPDFNSCSNECLNSLDERGFLCRSFMFDEIGKTCILYDEDTLFYGEVTNDPNRPSMANVKRPLKSSSGNLYRVLCVTSDRDRSASHHPGFPASPFHHHPYQSSASSSSSSSSLHGHETSAWMSWRDAPRPGGYGPESRQSPQSPAPYGGYGAGGGSLSSPPGMPPPPSPIGSPNGGPPGMNYGPRSPPSYGPTYPDSAYPSAQSPGMQFGGSQQNPSLSQYPPGHPGSSFGAPPHPSASGMMPPPPGYGPIPYHSQSQPFGPPHPNSLQGFIPPPVHYNPADRCATNNGLPPGMAPPGMLPPGAMPPGLPLFKRLGFGNRIRSQYVTKIIRAERQEDCERQCLEMRDFNCRSFNFRSFFSAENCELSTYDTKQLQLENPAHFEAKTQFDYFERDNSNAGNSILPGMLQYNNPADCVEVAQTCTPDGMEFTVKTVDGFYGRIYTYGFYDSCFYDGNGGSVSVLKISRANGFPRCGTQQYGDAMTNIVVVQFNDYVQTSRDKKYNLTCYFSGPGEAVVTSNYLDAKTDGRYPTQIEHLPAQNILTSNVVLRVLYRGTPTNTIVVGDLLTFRLEARGHYRYDFYNSDIFATNVIAKDPYTGRQVHLIDSRGCPVDLYVFPELHKTPDGALEAEFYAFKIPDSTFLVFQATVKTCRGPCEPVICQDRGRGHGSFPSWGRRKRETEQRDANDADEDTIASSEMNIEGTLSPSSGEVTSDENSLTETNNTDSEKEEVHELFRVYLSRADIPEAEKQVSDPQFEASKSRSKIPKDDQINNDDQQVCLTSSGYYILVTSVFILMIILAAVGAIAISMVRKSSRIIPFSDSLSRKMKLFQLNANSNPGMIHNNSNSNKSTSNNIYAAPQFIHGNVGVTMSKQCPPMESLSGHGHVDRNHHHETMYGQYQQEPLNESIYTDPVVFEQVSNKTRSTNYLNHI